VVGLVEELVEVGGDDVTGAGKDAHPGYSGYEGIDGFEWRTGSRGRARAEPLDLAVEPRSLAGRAAHGGQGGVLARHASSTTGAVTTTASAVVPSWCDSAKTLNVTIAATLTSAARPSLLVKNSRSNMTVIPPDPKLYRPVSKRRAKTRNREKSRLRGRVARAGYGGDCQHVGISARSWSWIGNPSISSASRAPFSTRWSAPAARRRCAARCW